MAAVKDKDANQDDTSDEEETAQEKRIRLAKEYIAELEEQGVHVQDSRICDILLLLLCRKAKVGSDHYRP